MLRGLATAIVVHGAVIGAAAISWPEYKTPCEKIIEQLEREQPGITPLEIVLLHPQCAGAVSIPMDIIEIGDVTDIAAVIKPEEPEEAEEQQLEEQEDESDAEIDEEEVEGDDITSKASDESDEEEVVIEDPNADEPTEEDDKADDPKEEEQELIRKEKPEEEDPMAFLDDFESILQDKSQERRKAPPKVETQTQKPVLADEDIQPRRGRGQNKGNTASLQAAMKRQVELCWRDVSDLPDPERLQVTVRMKLDIDGNIVGSAKTISPARRPVGDRYMGIAMDRALNAVRKCAPYKMPVDKFDQWEEINVNIGPKP